MISENIRRKLEALSGNATPPPAPESGPWFAPDAATAAPASSAPRLPLAGEGCATIDRAASDFWPSAARVAAGIHALVAAAPRRELSDGAACLLKALPASVVYLDIESCGFAGNPLFLVGALRVENGSFRLRQFFARNYDEEAAVLERVANQLSRGETLCTFNGKSFDWPFLKDRASVHRVALPETIAHCDLLHESRRTWGRTLPDCRLQTLEVHLCGRRRVADIPGAAIPDAYHHYVQSGDDRAIVDVIHHNAVDLVTLAELTLRLFDATAAV